MAESIGKPTGKEVGQSTDAEDRRIKVPPQHSFRASCPNDYEESFTTIIGSISPVKQPSIFQLRYDTILLLYNSLNINLEFSRQKKILTTITVPLYLLFDSLRLCVIVLLLSVFVEAGETAGCAQWSCVA